MARLGEARMCGSGEEGQKKTRARAHAVASVFSFAL
jgi:hypothetical protein